MGWSGWEVSNSPNVVIFRGLKTNVYIDQSSGWVHYLIAPADESNPNANHIHIKIHINGGPYIVAAVKVNGIREINRRKLIEAVNRETVLNLRY